MLKRISSSFHYVKHSSRLIVSSLCSVLLATSAVSGEEVLFDDFDHHWGGETLHGAATSDNRWEWNAHTSSATIDTDNSGNNFVNFNGESLVSLTWSSREGSGYFFLDPHKPFELEFDYLNLSGEAENRVFIVDYLMDSRWNNFGAVANTDPVGYRLYFHVSGDSTISYELLNKTNGEWPRVEGSVGSVEVDPGLLSPDGENPGRPVRVLLEVFKNKQKLSFDGEVAFDVDIDPIPQNEIYGNYNFIQFWSSYTQPRGIDNVSVRELDAPEPEPISIEPGQLYWANTAMIRAAESDASDSRTAADGLSRAIGVALDPVAERVYWTDAGSVMRADLTGENSETIIADGAHGDATQGIAVNAALGKVYWADFTTGLYSADLDGSNVQQLLDLADYDQTSGSAAVTIDEATNDVYWATTTDGTLVRMDHDGGNAETVATLDTNPYGLAFDDVENRMYYTRFQTEGDEPNGTLNYYDFDDQQATTILEGLGGPLGLAITSDKKGLFWTERTDGKIRGIAILEDGFGDAETLRSFEMSPFGLAAMPTATPVPPPPGPYVGFVNGDFESEDGVTSGWSFTNKIGSHAGIVGGSTTAAFIPSDKTSGDFPILSQHRPNWLEFDTLPHTDPDTNEPLAPELQPTGPKWQVSFYTAVGDAGDPGNRSLNIGIGNERADDFDGNAPAINFRINAEGGADAYWGGNGSTYEGNHSWYEVFPAGTFEPSVVQDGEFTDPTVYYLRFDGDYTLETPSYTVSAWKLDGTEQVLLGQETMTAFQYKEPATDSGIVTVRFNGFVDAPYVVDDVEMATVDDSAPEGFAAWSEEHFTADELADPSISGFDADADGDGIANLLEYAFGGNPRQAGSAQLPVNDTVEVDGKVYLTVTYTQAADDVDFQVEASDGLGQGSSWSGGLVEMSSNDNGDGTTSVTYRDTVAVDESNRRFIRVTVTNDAPTVE